MEVREMEKRKLGIQGSAYIGRRRSIRKEARVDAVAASSSGVACMQLGWVRGVAAWTRYGQEEEETERRGRCMAELRGRVDMHMVRGRGRARQSCAGNGVEATWRRSPDGWGRAVSQRDEEKTNR